MGGITFTKAQGGLNRRQAGEDHISGLVFYNNTLPSGFTTNSRIKEVYDLVTAEGLGITSTNADNGIKVLHYHVSEYFRINPGATLFVGIYNVPAGAHDFAELDLVRDFADGKIRQMAVYTTKVFDTAQVTLLQGKAAAAEPLMKMYSILYAADFSTIATSALVTLDTLTASNVSVILGQDGAAKGAALYTTFTKSITCLGAALGAASKAKVNECIGWVANFPMDEVELNVPALANGDLIKNLSQATVDAVNNKRYIFLIKYSGDSRSYFIDSHSAIALTSDYAYLENVRTIDKAIREVYKKLLPQVNGPVQVDAQTGKLDAGYVTHLENLGDSALVDMERAGELSGYKTFVDPDQNVLTTSQINVAIVNVPVGVSRKFAVKIGFAQKIPS